MPYIEPSLASSSPLGLPNPRFREASARDQARPSSSTSSASGVRHPNRYAGVQLGRQASATEYSPTTVYPPTDYGSPIAFKAPVPQMPDRWGTSASQPAPPAGARRPPPLDFTELLVLQAQPRDDIPVLSMTPSPRSGFSFRPGPAADRYASSMELTGTQDGSRRRASPASFVDVAPTPVPSSNPHAGRQRQTRFSLAPVSAWIGRLGLGDADKSRARKAVSRELRRLEGDRRELDRWDREREAEEERERIWQGIAPVGAAPAKGGVGVGVKDDLRPWSPLQIKKEKDPWLLFWRDKSDDAGGHDASGGSGNDGPHGGDIADAHDAQRRRRRRNLWVRRFASIILFRQAMTDRTTHIAKIILAVILVLLAAGIGILLWKLLARSSQPETSTTETTETRAVTSGSSTFMEIVTSTSTTTHAKATATATQSTAPAASSSVAPPPPVVNLASCLADFPPSNATSYCSTCNPFLTTATNEWTTTGGTAGVGAAVQWCGLRALYEATPAAESALGWFRGMNGEIGDICGWNGVTCDQSSRVIQLCVAAFTRHFNSSELISPRVVQQQHDLPWRSGDAAIGDRQPRLAPDSLHRGLDRRFDALYVFPHWPKSAAAADDSPSTSAGSLPSTVYSLSNLTSLSLVDTALSSAIPNTAFSGTSKLQSLVLVGNAGLGGSLPTGLAATGLTSLIVQGQSLSGNPVHSLPRSLTYLCVVSRPLLRRLTPQLTLAYVVPLCRDVSRNSLTSLSSISDLSSLTTLLATLNALTSLPNAFPLSLATLSLAQNSALSGQLSSDLCESAALTRCDVSSTQLKGNVNESTTSGNTTKTTTSCGVCTF